jgi:hypothetical protein
VGRRIQELLAGETPIRRARGAIATPTWACSPACARPSPGPLRLTSAPDGRDTRLTLVAASGIRLNARVKPALELPDGTVLRFDSPHVTADSAYFTRPPTAVLAGVGRRPAGTLRASVCAADELVCRSVTLEL